MITKPLTQFSDVSLPPSFGLASVLCVLLCLLPLSYSLTFLALLHTLFNSHAFLTLYLSLSHTVLTLSHTYLT